MKIKPDVILTILAIVIIFIGVLLINGCVVVPSITSAAGGWYTHQKIDKLEDGKVEDLDARVTRMENEGRITRKPKIKEQGI